MATNPGLFTEWPWKKLGNFKVAPRPHLHPAYGSRTPAASSSKRPRLMCAWMAQSHTAAAQAKLASTSSVHSLFTGVPCHAWPCSCTVSEHACVRGLAIHAPVRPCILQFYAAVRFMFRPTHEHGSHCIIHRRRFVFFFFLRKHDFTRISLRMMPRFLYTLSLSFTSRNTVN